MTETRKRRTCAWCKQPIDQHAPDCLGQLRGMFPPPVDADEAWCRRALMVRIRADDLLRDTDPPMMRDVIIAMRATLRGAPPESPSVAGANHE
jgi:hypothetical protein